MSDRTDGTEEKNRVCIQCISRKVKSSPQFETYRMCVCALLNIKSSIWNKESSLSVFNPHTASSLLQLSLIFIIITIVNGFDQHEVWCLWGVGVPLPPACLGPRLLKTEMGQSLVERPVWPGGGRGVSAECQERPCWTQGAFFHNFCFFSYLVFVLLFSNQSLFIQQNVVISKYQYQK